MRPDQTLQFIANKIAPRVRKDPGFARPIRRDVLRDYVDCDTMSELSGISLDILTDMVIARLAEMDRLHGPVDFND